MYTFTDNGVLGPTHVGHILKSVCLYVCMYVWVNAHMHACMHYIYIYYIYREIYIICIYTDVVINMFIVINIFRFSFYIYIYNITDQII